MNSQESQKPREPEESRREWFRTCARYVMLAGIVAGTAAVTRLGRPSAPGCRESASCRGCASLAGCRLPQAVLFKRRSGFPA